MKNTDQIYIGNNLSSLNEETSKGEQVSINNEAFYKISNVDTLRPFFMTIVSNSNHWMFIASNGGISAGRKNSNTALFPYYTDDKITESIETTGAKTVLKVQKDNKTLLWEPFSSMHKGVYAISRNLYKNIYGNKVIFEELNHDLNLVYTYEWNSSDVYGFVRKVTLTNNNQSNVKVSVLDGLQNILPYGVEEDLQKASSNLVDAYKRSELIAEAGLGIFALSAIIVDKAEPSEALKSNIVWSSGIENPTYLLSSLQLDNFRTSNNPLQQETDIKAARGAYFINFDCELASNTEKQWQIVANVNQSITNIQQVKETILNEKNIQNLLKTDIDAGTKQLIQLVGASDGIQETEDSLRSIRHFSNTMFNIMRGGIFDDNYTIEKDDFINYISKANTEVAQKKARTLADLPATFSLNHIKDIAIKDDDKDFKRLCIEYLPLKFSRRHGDPSRPWNKFSINTKSEIDGSKILDYEGNWRDIFQNWEALAHSYPEFIEGMIHKFLNATTFDGYNPYRVTKGGFDWETIEPDNPWAYIGYWGDHQIIYLLKFLEFIEKHYPNKLNTYFNDNLFVYANVPYKIKSYEDILKDSKNTIDFDFKEEEKIQERRNQLGVDGALVRDQNNTIYKVNFIEKILATVLAKMSNFIPEGGIWMNTQRPEWNDANNALVGNGVSMVTLYYLRRFLNFFKGILLKTELKNSTISKELALFFNQIHQVLESNTALLSNPISDTHRKTVLDGLGNAGSTYRNTIYNNGFSNTTENVSKKSLLEFVTVSLAFLEHSIDANKREDNLYHAYNLMTVESSKEVSIGYLPEMLEGQVAVLSSGYLSTNESITLLDSLKNSALFRPDQYSYILYPNKELPSFVNRNNIPETAIKKSKLLKELEKQGNTQIIEKDCLGNYHFNGNFNNVDSLKAALKALPTKYLSLVNEEAPILFGIFEDVFNHKAFTGRSGTFYGYEGLGSIYWHMVSKLLLAVQEVTLQAINENKEDALIGKLFDHYFEINEGIGVNKSPKLYGAFPIDAYSHTPYTKGAQQPGMTGQVKEDVLSRFGELGVFVKNGALQFNPSLLRKEEFLTTPQTFSYIDVNQEEASVTLDKGSLGFTYCQVPIIYKQSNTKQIEVVFKNGNSLKIENSNLDIATSKTVFQRTGEINSIIVSVIK